MPSSGSYGSRRNHIRTAAGFSSSNSQVGRSRTSTELNRRRRGTATAGDEQPNKDRTRRVLAYYTHAVVTFHTFGIPLSAGLTLEYYHNSLFLETRLSQISLIVGIQWLGIFALEDLAWRAYRWKHWRWTYMAVSLVLVLCHGIIARDAKPWGLSLVMRALTGFCLGFLRSMTLRCLASHYNDNAAEVSMQGGAAGLLGALVHSLVAWTFLRMDNYKGLAWANFYVVLFTLVPTLGGLFPAREQESTDGDTPKRDRQIPRLMHRKSTRATQSLPGKFGMQRNTSLDIIDDCFLLIGLLLVFAHVVVWPIFFPLLLSSRPLYEYPDFAAYWLLGTFGAGALTAAFFARPWPRRGLGVVNTFTAAAILAGSLLIIAAWVANFWVWGIISVLYGLCLGPLLALHMKVFDLLCKYWTKTRLFPFGLGIVVFGGVSVAGLMIQDLGSGSVALTVSGVVMLLGGCCMAVGRWLKYPTKYVVI
ncbi:hypothetical protein P171DRAFT_480270 [Karstenula rhodostoma CBS 690.94]|uniref:MFS general substrate transporter n=1 Tax=Karstenula rhodostoma CBS 690.94 TaxID=1392251 RepID=A0A9P4UGG4_9PLEO|nr:hypothetical protein P171DRAFT_480270 [Karstenula rhodostoma CBS 690.94]